MKHSLNKFTTRTKYQQDRIQKETQPNYKVVEVVMNFITRKGYTNKFSACHEKDLLLCGNHYNT